MLFVSHCMQVELYQESLLCVMMERTAHEKAMRNSVSAIISSSKRVYLLLFKVFRGWNLGIWVDRNSMLGNGGRKISDRDGAYERKEMGKVLCISWALFEG